MSTNNGAHGKAILYRYNHGQYTLRELVGTLGLELTEPQTNRMIQRLRNQLKRKTVKEALEYLKNAPVSAKTDQDYAPKKRYRKPTGLTNGKFNDSEIKLASKDTAWEGRIEYWESQGVGEEEMTIKYKHCDSYVDFRY